MSPNLVLAKGPVVDKKPASEKKNLLDVKNQVSEDLRLQKNKEKQQEKEANTAPEDDPNRRVDEMFGQGTGLTCGGNPYNCFPEPKRKVLPTRSDGLELGK